MKRWEELISKLHKKKCNILLLGGPDEKDELKQLKNKYNFLINTGSDNTLVNFVAIVDLCDCIITADTLALHVATALDKKIVALFSIIINIK